ncbi:hypothetical protein LguiA_011800 [Lonicera macranthoides]
MMVRPPFIILHRRFLCTKIFNHHHRRQWSVKQVTKSNFSESLDEIKNNIFESDFVALSLQKTGSHSAPWHRVLPVDTAETAYLKAKYAAERFQVLQFSLCPFSIRASKVIAHPYNFHLFPRDELKINLPSYSFSCQSSYLTSMAREGFDFNVCIYEGMSYLSRAQESAAKDRVGTPVSRNYSLQPSSAHSVADTVFIGRIKSRVKQWISACKDSNTKSEEALIKSLRKLILGSEEYGSRPCLSIDVCSERQVQLVLETLTGFSDDVVPLLIPVKGGGTRAVRVVLTSSKEDKDLFQKELQNMEEEQNKRFRGFREVIDLISTSQKPVVAHNSLNDFTFIHSKFLSPLPPTVDEFRISLGAVFPHVLDISHLMKDISPLNKGANLPGAISYIKKRFFAPMDMEIQIPHQGNSIPDETNECKTHHGHNVLKITELFAKICSILKITIETPQADNTHLSSPLKTYSNIFGPCSSNSEDPINEDVKVWAKNTTKIRTEDLVFLWGFKGGMSAGMLKSHLHESHQVFAKEFDVRLVDKSCAIVVFQDQGLSRDFLAEMDSGGKCSESVREMMSDGLRGSSYESYKRVCRLGLWEADLADALEKALAESDDSSLESQSKESVEVDWDSDLMINLDDL